MVLEVAACLCSPMLLEVGAEASLVHAAGEVAVLYNVPILISGHPRGCEELVIRCYTQLQWLILTKPTSSPWAGRSLPCPRLLLCGLWSSPLLIVVIVIP